MSIVTKGGDKGETSLFSGERVSKTDSRVEAYGSLDELDSLIGLSKHYLEDESDRALLTALQRNLHKIMGELASLTRLPASLIDEQEVEELTQHIRDIEAKVKLEGFVVPGACKESAWMDLCRSVARRAERRVLALAKSAPVRDCPLKYINRLSDFFFILARKIEIDKGVITYK